MSTKQRQSPATKKTVDNSALAEEDDICVLIYRESQLRKAEAAAAAAAAAAAERKTSTVSTHQKRPNASIQVLHQDDDASEVSHKSTKRKMPMPSSNEEADRIRTKIGGGGRRRRKICSSEGCTNIVVKGGVCIRHGAKKKLCSYEGCTNQSLRCLRHGAVRKRCSTEGCTNYAMKGGVCRRHGAKIKLCSKEGCTSQSKIGGVCIKHRAKC